MLPLSPQLLLRATAMARTRHGARPATGPARSCPTCGADKASDLPACVRHAPVPPTQAPVAPVPPSGGSPGGRCKHASPTHGACNGPAVPGSLYCRVCREPPDRSGTKRGMGHPARGAPGLKKRDWR